MKINKEYITRFEKHRDELKWLYMELYDNEAMFAELCDQMLKFYQERKPELKARDRIKAKNSKWYRNNRMLGMMLYIDNFAGDLNGVRKKLDYVKECNATFIHLMPFLDTVKGKSDGGYAVADFRKVRPDLGTMEDLAALAKECHDRDIDVCMDFVMNHTSNEHEWAKKALAGDGEYMSRYFFYDNPWIPQEFEKTVPQVFPTTAPGNFTWLPQIDHYVMTSFYPYQWDLNYANPRVFNEMMYNYLFFANQGMDIIRIDAVPYIWKKLGTSCRNLKEVHTIVRMMRMIGEIVCPAVALLGEVVMEPEKVVPYFGTVEKPECHMLYNVTTMATTWHSVAVQGTKLLKKQLDIVNQLPEEYTFLNYLRCHDDIGWGLDYGTLSTWQMGEVPHKKYLNDYFTGRYPGSESRGELYNDDPVTMDARFCGTAASMCGIESAGFEQNEEKMEKAIRKDLMLHAYMFLQRGLPMIYSGDEIGQVNDYTYKEDPEKREDSRYIHRGKFRWDLAKRRKAKDTVEGQIFQALNKMEELRRKEPILGPDAKVSTWETGDDGVLGLMRRYEGKTLVGMFNFTGQAKEIYFPEQGKYQDLLGGEGLAEDKAALPEFGFLWALK